MQVAVEAVATIVFMQVELSMVPEAAQAEAAQELVEVQMGAEAQGTRDPVAVVLVIGMEALHIQVEAVARVL